MSLGRWKSMLALGLWTLGCMKPPLMPPSQGGSAWSQLETAHFRVVSDLPPEQSEHVVAGFEEIYDLLGSVMFGRADMPNVHTQAVVFENYQDMRELYGDSVGGIYFDGLDNDLEPTPTLVASGSLGPFARVLFAHELTHRFNHTALGPTPLWLNEGLAEYYSTIRGESGQPVVGETDPRYMCASGGVQQAIGDIVCNYEVLRASSLPQIHELLGYEREGFYLASAQPGAVSSYDAREKRKRNYASAWLLVHMLQHAQHEYARSFRRLLKSPASQQKGAQLAELVAAVPSARLQADFDDYRQKTIPWREHHAQLPTTPSDLEQRPLRETEVLLWWARLDSFVGASAPRAYSNLKAARAAASSEDGDPSFWLGRYHAQRGEDDEAERFLREALQRDTGNPEYLLGLLQLYWGNREGAAWLGAARSPRVKALIAELGPRARTARQHSAVAANLLVNGDVPGALQSSDAACQAGPDCWQCFHNRAGALYAAGQTDAAIEAERTALDRLPERSAGALASAIRDALAFYSEPANAKGPAVRPGPFAP